MSNKSESRIYIGNLPPDVRTKDIEDLFYKYGKIRYIDLKNRKGPPFAFVEFEDILDAEDAIKGRDNYEFEGYRLRVEFQKGARAGRTGGGGGGGGGDRGGGGGGYSSRNSNAPPRRSENRVIISGLPSTGSWQDLKDHMRVAGNVCYADVFKDGTGVVEFIRYEDAKYAVKHLDDTKFRSHEGETAYIRVRMDSKRHSPSSRSRSKSRSRSRSRSRRSRQRERSSPSYSPVRRSRSGSAASDRDRKRSKHSRTRSKSRSKSAAASKSKSRSRSRSRSPRRSHTRSRSKSPADAAGGDNDTRGEDNQVVNGYDS